MKDKLKSRTFWLTVVWTAFVPISLIVQVFINIELPIEKIVELSGLLTITYVGGNKLVKNKLLNKEEER